VLLCDLVFVLALSVPESDLEGFPLLTRRRLLWFEFLLADELRFLPDAEDPEQPLQP